MITKIEMDAMNAVIGIHHEMRKANEVNWEQRRYEIAKEMMPAIYQESRNVLLRGGNIEFNEIAEAAVEFADSLIAELKKGSDEKSVQS